ncbi:MAG: DASS family sodium-coupled anion symporter [Deltaproteobacteria bacterium]|nr:DASS family sodium-coupled anion symporter [Deltaproteobacteria bacterium]
MTRSSVQWAGLLLAPALAALAYLVLPGSYENAAGETVAFSHAGRVTVGIGVWMAVWWMTEAIPIYATALIPLAFLPLFGAGSSKAAAAPYGHELIFLFMGGFILALSMERWGLHRRIAFFALRFVGTRPSHIVGAFMLVSAGLSMWVSNTATAIMMLPVALSVIRLAGPGDDGAVPNADPEEGTPASGNFALCLLLGVAYGCSIGGIGTLIGTPPNLFMASYVESQLGREISFALWMGIGLPLVACFLPLAWLLLTRLLYPIGLGSIEGGGALTREAYAAFGPMNAGERWTLAVFVVTAGLWITRPILGAIELGGARPFAGLSDSAVAILAAITLFVIPVDRAKRSFVMSWETAVKLPWGLLVLFGGGLSLAAAIRRNGVGELLGSQVSALEGVPSVLLVVGVVTLMIFLTELTSNTATAATLIPIFAELAPGLGVAPLLLVVPAAIGASCAFMLPVATPPNAIVFGSGHVTIPQMSRAGLWLNLLGIVLVTLLTYAVAVPMLGLALGAG